MSQSPNTKIGSTFRHPFDVFLRTERVCVEDQPQQRGNE